MTDDDDLQRVMTVLAAAWDEGCPIGPPDERLARVAIRRWRSYANRDVKPSDQERRIRDLANGLIQVFERDPRLVGPLKVDYEWLASRIAEALLTGAHEAASPATSEQHGNQDRSR